MLNNVPSALSCLSWTTAWGLTLRIVRVGEPDRLHRPVAQGLAAALGHDFDREAAVEIGRGLEFAEFGLLRREKRVDEGLVLIAAHRAIDVSLGVPARADLVVARLHPRHVHIDRMAVHDRRDRVEKGERAFARQSADRLGQRGGGERPGRDNDIVPVLGRKAGDLAAIETYKRMTEKGGLDGLRETVAVDRERASRRHLMRIGALKDDRAESAHLAMQDPDRIGRGVVGSEGVRANELGEVGSLVRSRGSGRPHFMQNHRNAGIRRLPRGFRAGKASANNVDRMHGRACHKAARRRQRLLWGVSDKPEALRPPGRADAPVSRRVSAFRISRSGRNLARNRTAHDEFDITAANADIIQLAIGELRQFTHRVAISAPS